MPDTAVRVCRRCARPGSDAARCTSCGTPVVGRGIPVWTSADARTELFDGRPVRTLDAPLLNAPLLDAPLLGAPRG